MRRALTTGVVGIVLLGGLAGCGLSEPMAGTGPATPGTATQETAAPLPSDWPTDAAAGRFRADLARVGYGDRDPSDPGLLDVGREACAHLRDGSSYVEEVRTRTQQTADAGQAENLVWSAVLNLCPEFRSRLP